MEENDFDASPVNDDSLDNKREGHESTNDVNASRSDEYELTAKDAGWHTPTLLVSPANFVYFDPPLRKKHDQD